MRWPMRAVEQPADFARRLSMSDQGGLPRSILPMPDQSYAGTVLYDAKDAEVDFPPIQPLRPPAGAPNVLPRPAAGRHRLRCLERLRRPLSHPDGGAAGRRWSAVHPVSHHGDLFTDPGRADQRPQPPHGRDGRHHRDVNLGTGVQLDAAEHLRPPSGDSEAERVRDRACREVSRGAGLGDQSGGSVRSVAGGTAFTGEIMWIELEAGQDSHDHLIDPERFLRVAMWKR